jgi:hypothetical protein
MTAPVTEESMRTQNTSRSSDRPLIHDLDAEILKRLESGLQNHGRRFESGSRLHKLRISLCVHSCFGGS